MYIIIVSLMIIIIISIECLKVTTQHVKLYNNFYVPGFPPEGHGDGPPLGRDPPACCSTALLIVSFRPPPPPTPLTPLTPLTLSLELLLLDEESSSLESARVGTSEGVVWEGRRCEGVGREGVVCEGR